MDRTLFNLLNTGAPAATLVVRLLAGLVFEQWRRLSVIEPK
jgi:hypothetical protein